MATGEIIPETDVVVAWQQVAPAGTHESKIDEDRNFPITADYIWAEYADNLDWDEFQMTTLDIEGGTVSQVAIKCYAKLVGASSGYNVQFWNGTSWSTIAGVQLTTSYAWKTTTLVGYDFDQDALNACKVKVQAAVAKGLNEVYIATMYVVVTYEPAAAGWGHKIQGVANANIAKIMGIPIANIAKVMGV